MISRRIGFSRRSGGWTTTFPETSKLSRSKQRGASDGKFPTVHSVRSDTESLPPHDENDNRA
jgi:hypothetical protein